MRPASSGSARRRASPATTATIFEATGRIRMLRPESSPSSRIRTGSSGSVRSRAGFFASMNPPERSAPGTPTRRAGRARGAPRSLPWQGRRGAFSGWGATAVSTPSIPRPDDSSAPIWRTRARRNHAWRRFSSTGGRRSGRRPSTGCTFARLARRRFGASFRTAPGISSRAGSSACTKTRRAVSGSDPSTRYSF